VRVVVDLTMEESPEAPPPVTRRQSDVGLVRDRTSNSNSNSKQARRRTIIGANSHRNHNNGSLSLLPPKYMLHPAPAQEPQAETVDENEHNTGTGSSAGLQLLAMASMGGTTTNENDTDTYSDLNSSFLSASSDTEAEAAIADDSFVGAGSDIITMADETPAAKEVAVQDNCPLPRSMSSLNYRRKSMAATASANQGALSLGRRRDSFDPSSMQPRKSVPNTPVLPRVNYNNETESTTKTNESSVNRRMSLAPPPKPSLLTQRRKSVGFGPSSPYQMLQLAAASKEGRRLSEGSIHKSFDDSVEPAAKESATAMDESTEEPSKTASVPLKASPRPLPDQVGFETVETTKVHSASKPGTSAERRTNSMALLEQQHGEVNRRFQERADSPARRKTMSAIELDSPAWRTRSAEKARASAMEIGANNRMDKPRHDAQQHDDGKDSPYRSAKTLDTESPRSNSKGNQFYDNSLSEVTGMDEADDKSVDLGPALDLLAFEKIIQSRDGVKAMNMPTAALTRGASNASPSRNMPTCENGVESAETIESVTTNVASPVPEAKGFLVDSPARNTRSADKHIHSVGKSTADIRDAKKRKSLGPETSPSIKSFEKRQKNLGADAGGAKAHLFVLQAGEETFSSDSSAEHKTGTEGADFDENLHVDEESDARDRIVKLRAETASTKSQMTAGQLNRHKSILQSAEKPASLLKKTVAFGSPEIAEFNCTSPSTNLTPMTTKAIAEDSLDLESLVRYTTTGATLHMSPRLTNTAGSTPAQETRTGSENSSFDVSIATDYDGHSPVDSVNVGGLDLINNSAMSTNSSPDDSECPATNVDQTDQLDKDLNCVLDAALAYTHESFSVNDSRMSIDETFLDDTTQVDQTVPLDVNMDALLKASEQYGEPINLEERVGASNQLQERFRDSSFAEDEVTGNVEITVQLDASIGELLRKAQDHEDASDTLDAVSQTFTSQAVDTMPNGAHRSDSTVGMLVAESDDHNQMETIKICSNLVPNRSIIFAPTPSKTPTRRRRSSASANRFCLTPCRQLKLSADGQPVNTSPTVIESIATGMRQSPQDTSEEEYVDLKNSEIMDIASTHVKRTVDTFSDILTDVVQSTSDLFTDESLKGAVTDMMNLVCAELETKLSIRIDPDDAFVETSNDGSDFFALQQAIRTGDNNDIMQSVELLCDASCQEEKLKLESWFCQVAEETLIQHLDVVEQDCATQLCRLDELSTFLDEQVEMLSSINAKALQKAKRKSLDRRKTKVSLLEEEISELEEKLGRATEALNQDKKKYSLVSGLSSRTALNLTLKSDLAKMTTLADKAQQKYCIVCGSIAAKAVSMEGDKLSFKLIGSCPASCLRVDFVRTIPGEEVWACKAHVDKDLFEEFVGRPCFSSTALVKARVAFLSFELEQLTIKAPNTIGDVLRSIEIRFGRIESTAFEVAALVSRFKAKLLSGEEVPDMLLEVIIANRLGDTKLSVTFEISEAYPFAPVYCDLNGDVDITKLRAILSRNAKPGFGHLMRTCDLIQAFLA
jgi:hypothetical protein